MSARPQLSDLEVGQEIGTRTVDLDRSTLVRYAGASGDFNPIHWNDVVAQSVGLPGVIAHGMLTMGSVVALVTDWAQDPGAVVDYQTRFSRPVAVPNPGTSTVEVSGVVGALDAEAGTARVDLTVTFEGARVLATCPAGARRA